MNTQILFVDPKKKGISFFESNKIVKKVKYRFVLKFGVDPHRNILILVLIIAPFVYQYPEIDECILSNSKCWVKAFNYFIIDFVGLDLGGGIVWVEDNKLILQSDSSRVVPYYRRFLDLELEYFLKHFKCKFVKHLKDSGDDQEPELGWIPAGGFFFGQ